MAFLKTDTPEYREATAIISGWVSSGRRLPPGFDGWVASSAAGFQKQMPLVDLAIRRHYPLPENFPHWEKKIVKADNTSTTVAHFAAEHGYPFPASFAFWGIKNSRRRMVIEVFLGHKYMLPPDFDQWRLRSEVSGETVAHLYLMELGRPMPASFNEWGLVNRIGSTVAHEAVRVAFDLSDDSIGALPPDRSIWLLERRDRHTGENDGNTALHLRAALGGSIPDIFTLEDWHLRNPREKSVIDLARDTGRAQLVAQYEALRMRSAMVQSIRGSASKSRISRGVT